MTKRIFRAIWLAALSVLMAALALSVGVVYNHFTDVQFRQLREETFIAAQAVSNEGIGYLQDLEDQLLSSRITWVDVDGTVLYDTLGSTESMGNHLERQEVRQALETGFGQATRQSDTFLQQYLYTAQRLPDGTVLRFSTMQSSVIGLVREMFGFLALVLLVAAVLSMVLASRLSQQIVKPINEMDLNDPLSNREYEEILPLLRRMDSQQRQLEAQEEEKQKNEALRREFTANVSHELKTPLHAISGFAELMKSGLVPAGDMASFSEKIYKETQRLILLVEDTLRLQRLDEGSVDLQWIQMDLPASAEAALRQLRSAAELAKVELQLKAQPATVYAIPQLVSSILFNLLDNAIKYNRPGGKVTVTIAQGDQETLLIVQDTGIGIPKEHRERIFERFYRVDKSHSKAVGGTGLGLSLVKHAALILGARVTLESEEEKGTTVTVCFPEKLEKSLD